MQAEVCVEPGDFHGFHSPLGVHLRRDRDRVIEHAFLLPYPFLTYDQAAESRSPLRNFSS